MRLMIDFPAARFAIGSELRLLLARVSPAAIDRILKPERDKGGFGA